MTSSKSIYTTVFFFVLLACTQKPDAQAIIDKAIAQHGGENLQEAVIDFDFRDRHYKAVLNQGLFQYERSWADSLGRVQDVLTNEGFSRTVNDQPFSVSDENAKKYANSVNSVIYFALLPYFLNDPAVIKEYVGEANLDGESYHKIKVTFQQEGGGDDHDDIFIYWFHQDTYQMDYLAYEYEREGGGSRFRKAYNQREIGGVLFADYINYKGPYPTENLADFDKMYEQGALEELSRIDLENMEVKGLSSAEEI